MPTCWFVLLRYFLRVDDVLSEISDTRMFYEFETPHILVEHTIRKGNLADLKVSKLIHMKILYKFVIIVIIALNFQLSPHVVIDPNVLSQHLPMTSQTLNKIVLPNKS